MSTPHVSCLYRFHHKLTQSAGTQRSWYKNRVGPGFFAFIFLTASYAGSPTQGYVPGSLNVSKAAVAADVVETVTVMMGVDEGPAAYRATGFLHSFSPTAPSDDLVVPLKPRMFRLNAVFDNEAWTCYARVKQLGAKMQLVVSDSYGYDNWPGYNQYKSAWETTIADLVAQADSLGFADIEWDMWNEPNYSQFWRASTQQFYDAWEIGYLKLRSFKPNAVIVGPSSTGSIQYVKDFLLFAKAHNVLPDVVSFHVIWDNERNIPSYASDLRAFMARNGINIQKISINEYDSFDGSDPNTTSAPNPGRHVRLLANLERAGVDSAAKSSWSDCCTLDNVAPNNSKTPLWWAYKAYADITGRLVQVGSSPSIDGIAGHDSSTRTARVILGRHGGAAGDIAVSITALDQVSYLAGEGKVHVVAEKITRFTSGSTLPQRVIDTDYAISNNQITVILPGFASTEAFVLTLSSPAVSNDLIPPAISSVEASVLTPSSAVITWTTNEASDSQVEYGTTTSYGQITSLSSALVSAHNISLSGLSAQTPYNYRVRSKDFAGNSAVSSNYTFTTGARQQTVRDNIPPEASITYPSDGAKVTRNSTLTINAQAADNIAVSRVEFYVNGDLECTDTAAEDANVYKCNWSVPKRIGVTYRLRAAAYDASNNSSSSTVISVTSK